MQVTQIFFSYLLEFPLPPPEYGNGNDGHGQFTKKDGIADTIDLKVQYLGKYIGHRNFQKPEGNKVDPYRSGCITGPIDGVDHHHAHGVNQESKTEQSQAGNTTLHHDWIIGSVNKESNERFGDGNKNDGHQSKENHIAYSNHPC